MAGATKASLQISFRCLCTCVVAFVLVGLTDKAQNNMRESPQVPPTMCFDAQN